MDIVSDAPEARYGGELTAPQRIDIDDPEVGMDEGRRLLYRGEPFSGEVVEYLSGHLVSLDVYVDGVQSGISREWYTDGTPRSAGMTQNGLPSGESKEWHPNGQLAVRQVFSTNGLTLLEDFRWDKEGRPTRSWRLDEDGEGLHP